MPSRPSLTELEPLVQAALAQYGLTPAEVENLRYSNNATYRVRAASGDTYVLRVTCNYYSEAELSSEMQWLSAMQADPAVRVPRPVAAADGRLVIRASAPALAEPRSCTLVHWLEGEHLPEARLNAQDFTRVGLASAQLHERSAAFVPPDGFARTSWDAARWLDPAVGGTYERILTHLHGYMPGAQVRHFGQLAQQAGALLRSLRPDPGQYGLVHGDFHAGNYLFHPDQVSFIDFEDLGWGCYLYDVATALFGVLERPEYPTLLAAFASGYTRIRPLPAAFAQQLSSFQVLRAIFLTSLVVTWGEPAQRAWWESYVVGKLPHLLGNSTASALEIYADRRWEANPLSRSAEH